MRWMIKVWDNLVFLMLFSIVGLVIWYSSMLIAAYEKAYERMFENGKPVQIIQNSEVHQGVLTEEFFLIRDQNPADNVE